MNDKTIAEFVDLLYPYFIKKIKEDGAFKNCIRSVNATVTWVEDQTNVGANVMIRFPYDTTEISVTNKSAVDLVVGDLVCVHYYIDLKNAYVAYKL